MVVLQRVSPSTSLYPFNSLFNMSSPNYIKIPREEAIFPDTGQQNTSEQIKNWLQEGHKDVPWHNLDSVAASSSQDKSNSDYNDAQSDNPATHGSDE
ncbi:hypothetical protein FBEOM_12969 [Fusarium beomiforme]|uniref:Uncharacterized protein n=1 Tax=Fusarium beomiforme TaxID=44412 RepID=A0A9P5A6Q0_9HYPO|nr:hypothetical protein FBEOM_12969 [Fusarium beomiforme]